MSIHQITALLSCCALLSLPTVAPAAEAPDAAALVAAQRQALDRLAALDGLWRGSATITTADGRQVTLTQTERVGPLLGGALRLIEGRGYLPDGSSPFNAFAVVSYSPRTGGYSLRSHAQGHSGDFPFEVTADGFSWSVPAGPATIRYTAIVKDGTWSETGERIVADQPPSRIYEMKLQRIGDTDWPAGGAVGPGAGTVTEQ